LTRELNEISLSGGCLQRGDGSLPCTPCYNAAVELCNGVLKRFASSLARNHGRLECWSCDDVRNARDAIGDLRREGGLTRRETFASRTPIRNHERAALRS